MVPVKAGVSCRSACDDLGLRSLLGVLWTTASRRLARRRAHRRCSIWSRSRTIFSAASAQGPLAAGVRRPGSGTGAGGGLSHGRRRVLPFAARLFPARGRSESSDPLRSGSQPRWRELHSRRVVAIQHGRQIFTFSASFQIEEPGFEHQIDPPEVPATRNAAERRRFAPQGSADKIPEAVPRSVSCARARSRLRPVDRDGIIHAGKAPAAPVGVGARDGPLPDDLSLHQCVLAYASDMTLLDTALLPHGIGWFDDACRWRASITRCGFIARSAPTNGFFMCRTAQRLRRARFQPRPGLYRGWHACRFGGQEGLIRPRGNTT